MNSRQQTILQMVIDQGQVSVTDLAKATGVSEVTIRQDLNTLEKLSYLRVHMALQFRLIVMTSKPV
ncbi:DeoR-family transcriptional regulator [Escherichia coli]|uniref:DeoR-family transcriptional regulator n=1 Tax=Escherichia coli TaxID=562 RepID=A0A376UAL7_ECOLX|nr:DeoR-family transcriptional regulator [Escherichia coli]